jgi:hypothetical protein
LQHVPQLLNILAKLPESLQQEVLNYAEVLAQKYAKTTSQEILSQPRTGFGSWQGQITMIDNFDAPLEDLTHS